MAQRRPNTKPAGATKKATGRTTPAKPRVNLAPNHEELSRLKVEVYDLSMQAGQVQLEIQKRNARIAELMGGAPAEAPTEPEAAE